MIAQKIDLEKIIALRKHYEITQEEAAKALDIGRVTYIMREKNGSFTDEELNKLSKLLNVERSELVKKEDSWPSPVLRSRLNAFSNRSNYETEESEVIQLWRELDELKLELTADVKKTIDERTKALTESESTYQSKYICLLEEQLREKEEMVKELKETLLRLEAQTKFMFEKINSQFSEFFEEIKFQLDENRNFSMKAIEQLNEETKEQQQIVSEKLNEFSKSKFLIELRGSSSRLSPESIKEKLKLYLHAMEEFSNKEFAKAKKRQTE